MMLQKLRSSHKPTWKGKAVIWTLVIGIGTAMSAFDHKKDREQKQENL